MTDELTNELVRRWMHRFAELLVDNAGRLTDLDAKVGDADHGTNMARGAYALREALVLSDAEDPSSTLFAVGQALLEGIGGAAGPLYSSLVIGMAESSKGKATLKLTDLAAAVTAGVEAMAARGLAELRDKTMYDSALPAARALEAGAAIQQALSDATAAARLAAASGLESTAPLQARKGRASYIGPRSVGYLDPGAASVALLFDALADAVAPVHAPNAAQQQKQRKPKSTMKKLMNDPASMVGDALRGIKAAHPELSVNRNPDYVCRSDAPSPNKVAVVSGGGSGHEPLHCGFVGPGMLDVAVLGAIFASPSAPQIHKAAQAVATKAGILFIVKNYTGDRLNFQMAADMLVASGVTVEVVIVDDDVAVEDSTHTAGRRGTGATVVVEKVAGAAAEQGLSLTAVARIARRVADSSGSIGLALTSSTVPHVGEPNFAIGDDEVEFGVGIHGEPGRSRRKLAPASELLTEMADAVTRDLALGEGDRVIAIVNGLGATPLIELYVMAGELAEYCTTRRIVIERMLVGNFVTSLDMTGCTLTLTKVEDDTLALWDAPVQTNTLQW